MTIVRSPVHSPISGPVYSALSNKFVPSLYWGQVATKSYIPSGVSTTNKTAQSRSHHIARDDISALKIEIPNWYWARGTTGPETNGGGNITATLSVEYPAGTFWQGTFSGATSKVIASGASALSDAIAVNIPKGASFWVRIFVNAATAIVFCEGNTGFARRDLGNGEAYEYSASTTTDKTMGGTVNDNGAATAPIFVPTAIIAQTSNPSVLIIGDSRDWGFTDTLDTSGDLGDIARSIGPSFGYINASCAGDTFSALIAGGTKRQSLKQYVSHVIVGDAINALRSGGSGQNKTAATVLLELQSILAMFSDRRCFTTTCGGPNPTSSDNFATTANQAVNANSAQITAYNDAIRAGVANSLGFFEIADQVESARNSGKWWVTGVANATTSDGLHSTQAGYLRIKNSGAVDVNRITRAGL
ncbi:MAG: SGNH/GDSL hydrolase family protein [Hyphomicrobiales bacterium]|nr:MAG: SGNH/GDSL hydrolase family protein [Hyphomicrobiales bacterium]